MFDGLHLCGLNKLLINYNKTVMDRKKDDDYEEEEIEYADETVYTAKDYTVEIRGYSLPKLPSEYKSFYENRFPGSRVVRVSLIFKGTGNLLRAMSKHFLAEKK